MDLTELFSVMRSKENFHSGTGISPVEVDRLETELQVSVSDEYRAFLQTFSYAWWFGHSILGIAPGARWDALKNTIEARKAVVPEWFAPFPGDAIVLEVYDAGGFYLLRDERSAQPGVVLLSDEEGYQPLPIADSFGGFLEYLLF
jgi:hypothetical protein